MANTIFHGHDEHILQCQCGCCGAGLTFPFEVKQALQAVLRGTRDLVTLSTRLARHSTAEQQEGNFFFGPALLDHTD